MTSAVVTIPAAEYAELLYCRSQLIRRESDRERFMHPLGFQSWIDRDAEVAAFLAARFGDMTLMEILTACEARFGANRTPSRSAAHRFWQRLRTRIDARVIPRETA